MTTTKNKGLTELRDEFLKVDKSSVDKKGGLIMEIKKKLEENRESEKLQEWCLSQLDISLRTFQRYFNRELYISKLDNKKVEKQIRQLPLGLSYILTDPKANEALKKEILEGKITTKKEAEEKLAELNPVEVKKIKLKENEKVKIKKRITDFKIKTDDLTDNQLVEIKKLLEKVDKVLKNEGVL